MKKANIIATQSKSDFSAAPPSEKLNEMIENGHAVITQSSEDLFQSVFADTDKSVDG
jgi:hypothetical protein